MPTQPTKKTTQISIANSRVYKRANRPLPLYYFLVGMNIRRESLSYAGFFSVVARDLRNLYFHTRYLIHYHSYHITVVTYTLTLEDLWISIGGKPPHAFNVGRLLNHLVCVELSKFVEVMRCWQ